MQIKYRPFFIRRLILAVSLMAPSLTALSQVRDEAFEADTIAPSTSVDSIRISVANAEAAIKAVSEFQFTPPPGGSRPVDGVYGRLDSIRADFLNVARRPAVVSGPFDGASGSAMLAGWQGGSLSAYGSREHLPGLMGIEEGGLYVGQSFGAFTVGTGASVSKYAYFGGMRRSFGLHGNVEWRLSDMLSLRVFGSYYGDKNSFVTPAVSGYMGSNSYGASLRVDASDKWGIDIGAQRIYNTMTGRWETVPIARPFFKINGREAIGIDVGGILHEFLRSKVGGSRGNPTMAPPIPTGYPPVRPREDW